MKVEVLASAKSEFRKARHWYRDQSINAARRFALEVKSAIAAIRQSPETFPQWDDSYRFYLLNKFPYFIGYRYTSSLIVIVAIRHTSRDQDAWKGR